MNVRRFVPLVVLLVAACGGARRGSLSNGADRPFVVSSIGSSYGIQARLEGSIVVRDGWVYVIVPRGAVRTYQLDRQEYWDLRLRAGVATCQGREAEIVSEGRAARLAPALGLSRDSAYLDTTIRQFRDTLRVDVGVPPATDLVRSWVALIFEWPFQNIMATYTVHTNVPLNSGDAWTGRQAENPGERCR